MTQLGDELLIAFSDGELSTRQREEIGCVLEHDPITSLRLKKMQNTRNRLTVLFNDIFEDHHRLRVEDLINFPKQVAQDVTQSAKGGLKKKKALGPQKDNKPVASSSAFPTMAIEPVRSQGYVIAPEQDEEARFEPETQKEGRQQQAASSRTTKSATSKVLLNGFLALTILASGLVAGYFYQKYMGIKSAQELMPNLYAPVVNGGWTTAVINHHSLLRRETIEAAKVNQKNIALIQNQLNSALGMQVTIPNLSNHGISFARAQILTHNNEKIAQITYLPEQGSPLSLYIKKGEKTRALINGSLGEVNMVHWAQNKNGFVLVGSQPHWKLIVISVDVKRQFTP